MLIDCDACALQHTDACDDCVVTFILREFDGGIDLDADDDAALEHLADAGLVPPLRLVPVERPAREAG